MRKGPAISHKHWNCIFSMCQRKDKSSLWIIRQFTFRDKQTTLLPRTAHCRSCEIIIIILFPTCLIWKQKIINALLFKHGRWLATRRHILHESFFCRMIILAKTIDISFMNQQIACPIGILKSSHIPHSDRFIPYFKRSLEYVLTINSFTSGIPDTRITVFRIIGMHIHHIFSSRRALHDLHTFTNPIRT